MVIAIYSNYYKTQGLHLKIMTTQNNFIEADNSIRNIKIHQIAFLVILTTFMSELVQTFIIPCAIYLPNIQQGFFAEFSYGVYFLGSITGLICGLFISKYINFRSMYLLGIRLNLFFTTSIAIITTFGLTNMASSHVFYWLYPYRILTGFSTNLTYGINSALIVQVFASPVKTRIFGKNIVYASNKLFSWSYIILLLEMTLNPVIDYHLFNNCSWHIATTYLAGVILVWLLIAQSALPKHLLAPKRSDRLKEQLKNCLANVRFLKLSSCAGMLTGAIIIISVELPFLITQFFGKSTNQYSSINLLLIICSAFGAFVASLHFIRKIKLKIAQIILVIMISLSIIYYFLPTLLSCYVIYLAFIYICIGFCGPVLNDLIMLSVKPQYQVTSSILLNGCFLLFMVSFNFLDAAVLHTMLDMQVAVFICLILALWVIHKTIKQSNT